MDANRTSPQYELTDELARYCLPPANRNSNRNLAWVNSVCIFFLLIGILGAKQPVLSIKHPPPLAAQIVPTVIEPPPPPKTEPESIAPTEEEKAAVAPQVVAVTLDSPAIHFSVPTIGNLVVPSALAAPPPLNPSNAVQRLVERPVVELRDTERGGDRPAPVYPKLALDEGLEGAVTLSITGDANGAATAVNVVKSSDHTLLDQAAADVVKKRWILPRGTAGAQFQTTIKFELQKR